MQWITQETDINNDPRFSKINNNDLGIYLRLKCLAGESEFAGALVDRAGQELEYSDIAFKIRVEIEDLKITMANLKKANLIHKNGAGWVVNNHGQERYLSARQDNAQRQRRHRNKITDSNRDNNNDNNGLRLSPIKIKTNTNSKSRIENTNKSDTIQPTKGAGLEPEPEKLDLDKLSNTQKEIANLTKKAFGAYGLGNKKLREVSIKLAMRISFKNAVPVILAAIASVEDMQDAKNKPALAAWRVVNDQIPKDYFSPSRWTEKIPAAVWEALGVESPRVYTTKLMVKNFGVKNDA